MIILLPFIILFIIIPVIYAIAESLESPQTEELEKLFLQPMAHFGLLNQQHEVKIEEQEELAKD